MSDIWDRVNAAVAEGAAEAAWNYRQWTVMSEMGSEIERALAVTFAVMTRISGHDFLFSTPTEPKKGGFFLAPQFPIENFRADFLFGFTSHPLPKNCVVIECDGHQWHEKTKEQAARDKSRDRVLSLHAARVIHFTGSEIYRDPAACFIESMKALGAANNLNVGDL